MKTSVLSLSGEKTKNINLKDSVFACEVNESALYYAVVNELANKRQGTASTKTRSEVHGSRKKLWRQKGTGRARMGTRQSPVWVGGGVAFGPRPRNYNYKITKKLKRLAFKSILSLKYKNNCLTIIEDFEVENGKTRILASMLKNFVSEGRVVLIISDSHALVKRAGRNIPWLTTLSFDKLRVHDLFYCKHILILESSAKELNSFFSESSETSTSNANKGTTNK